MTAPAASPPRAIAFAALAAAAANLPTLFNGFTNWDDDHYLTINPLVLQLTPEHVWRYFSSFQLSNYHPLTLLAHALWHHLFGLAPLPHHALSLALHAANAALFFALAAALGAGRSGALAAALLFAVHPLQVEAVAWAAQLKTLLATFFLLAALLSYVRRTSPPAPRFPAAALALGTFSLLAKPAAVLLPLVLLLVDRLRGRPSGKMALLEKVPFALIALASGCLTLAAQREALRPATEQPLSHGPFVAAHGVLFMLTKAVLPAGFSALYPYPSRPDGGLPWTFLAAPVALAVLAAVLWRHVLLAREARFGALFFLALLAPALQLIPVGFAHAADRYFYLPSIGLFFGVGCALDRTLAGPRGRAPWALLLAAVALMGALSWRRAAVWRDGVTLWSDVIAGHPSSYVAWGNLGQALTDRGDIQRAIPALNHALELGGNRRLSAEFLFRRATAWQQAGEPAKAVDDYSRGLVITPDDARVLVNRGNALDTLGKPDAALADYARAIEIEPDNALAWYNRGVTLVATGNHAAAVESLDQALRLAPQHAPTYRKRADALEALGRRGEAADDRRRAAYLETAGPRETVGAP